MMLLLFAILLSSYLIVNGTIQQDNIDIAGVPTSSGNIILEGKAQISAYFA